MTKSQTDHLQAADSGALYANWHGGPVRRWVRTDAKVSQQVCERLVAAGLITLTLEPGCSVKYRAERTDR
jgi:hypothetical protein